MKKDRVIKCVYRGVTVVVLAVLIVSLIPIQAVRAQDTTTSDLAVSLVSVPKHAKACQVFEVTFTVTNLGPDPADDFFVSLVISDHFDIVGILEAPESLEVGETATISVAVKVTAFVPGETRTGRVLASATFEPEASIDPDLDNNFASGAIRLISRPVLSCGQ